MNRSTIIIVASGFFFALLAAMAVQMLGSGGRKSDDAPARMVEVLVAAKDIAIGEELKPGSTTWTSWPETSNFSGAIRRIADQSAEDALKGRTVRSIAKGEPMLKSAMIDDTKSNFVAASLTPGNRAVAINVNAQTSVAGFVMSGDRVDVVLTYDVRMPSDDKIRKAAQSVVTKTAAETILENIRVLATDQQTGSKADIKVAKTVTLEVTPQQAETLILAGKMGQLSLSLRSIGDASLSRPTDAAKSPITTDMRLSGVMREIMKGENKSGRLSQVVRVYSGTRVENVEVRPYTTLD